MAQAPQPNFALLNQASAQISAELTKFQNLPQIVDAGAILVAIQELRDAVQALTENVDGLEVRLTRRMRASARNEIARIQNSTRNLGTAPLILLVNATTGEPINEFPATIAALNTMTRPNLIAVLNALGESEAGTIAECRTRLLHAVGVVMQAV